MQCYHAAIFAKPDPGQGFFEVFEGGFQGFSFFITAFNSVVSRAIFIFFADSSKLSCARVSGFFIFFCMLNVPINSFALIIYPVQNEDLIAERRALKLIRSVR